VGTATWDTAQLPEAIDRGVSAGSREGPSSDPFFRAGHIHWRGERVEGAIWIGLSAWLLRELHEGRAYFSAEPGADGVLTQPARRDT
jgi:hypothetical protein